MSATKALKKLLPTMTVAALTVKLECLRNFAAAEKNAMIRSSLAERAQMVKRELEIRQLVASDESAAVQRIPAGWKHV